MAAQLLVHAAEEVWTEAQRQVPGEGPQPVERPGAPTLLDLALDGAPEQVEDLGHDDHRGHSVIAQRIEDDARVAAADVEDVRADVERVVEPDRLFEQVREREQRDQPVFHRRHDPVERLDRGDDVVVREHHALWRAGRARCEDELEDLVGGGATPGALARLPIGRERRIVRRRLGRERLDGRGREVIQPGFARVGRVAAGAQDEVPGPGRLDDSLHRQRRHPKVERHEHEARGHRAVVGGGELGGGRGPGEDAVARFEAQRSQPPRRDPAPPLQLAEAPLARGPVVVPQRERGPLPVARDGGVEQVEEGRHRGEGTARISRR